MGWAWITFANKMVTDETIDHQHLSNILWYYKVVLDDHSSKEIQKFRKTLSDRFNGQILPYRPHINLTGEIELLRKRGMLQNVNQFGADIFYKGRKIGEYQYHVEWEL